MESFLTNIGIPLALFITAAAVVLILIFAVYNIFINFSVDPKGTLRSLLGVIILLVLILLAWMLVPGEITGVFKRSNYADITPGIMRAVEAGITLFFILFGTACTMLLIALVSSLFKN